MEVLIHIKLWNHLAYKNPHGNSVGILTLGSVIPIASEDRLRGIGKKIKSCPTVSADME